MKIIGTESYMPKWKPVPGSIQDRAKWLHEWFERLPADIKKHEAKRRTACCRDLVTGFYTGSIPENNVAYVNECGNCRKVLAKRLIPAKEIERKRLAANDEPDF